MAGDADDVTSSGEKAPVGLVAVGHHAGGIGVVTMSGEHDLSTQPALADALELAAAHSNVVVDLTECSFIDSTIIQEFIRTSETLRAKGDQVMLVIPAEQAGVARIVEMVGLARFFELHETTEAAFASLEGAKRDQPDS
jgi:anti-sigma B factor antagonist